MRSFLRIVVAFALLAALCLSGRNVAAATNVLRNPGFEAGDTLPEAWHTFPRRPRDVTYTWDDSKSYSGKRSARVDGSGQGFGMWQQVVDVEPGRVYVFTAHVAFEDVARPGQCYLQLVFRDANNDVVKFIDLPGHGGTREFALDFPPKLKIRAPAESARVEVNLFLRGTGKAWFDDVCFGPAPTGTVSGTVTFRGNPVEGARVFVWGNPWDKTCEAHTDRQGRYRLADIPVAFPRYVLLAKKPGYRSRPVGDVEVSEGKNTTVDFDIVPGSDPDDLRVKFGTLGLRKFVPPFSIPDGAAIPTDAAGYPESVRPFLKADEYIQSEHPRVVAKAEDLLATLPLDDRRDTRKVAWAAYEWVSKHIDHGGVFSSHPGGLRQPYRDVTSGIWQTISGDGWCWGRSFLDWCYRPQELLEVETGICVEHAWLVSALLRALNVPARASVGSLEFWAQDTKGSGGWVHMSTTGGRTSFREDGRLGPGFGRGAPADRFSVLSRPILHEDWDAQNPGLWRERHPWRESYQTTPSGYAQAKADLERFATTGEAPRATSQQPAPRVRRQQIPRPPRDAGAQETRDLAVQRRPQRQRPADCYQVHYSDVTINLLNMGDQRTLDVRFPLPSEPPGESLQADNAHWTNHPECVRRTWIERISNPPVEGAERWFHMEFDLTSLFDD